MLVSWVWRFGSCSFVCQTLSLFSFANEEAFETGYGSSVASLGIDMNWELCSKFTWSVWVSWSLGDWFLLWAIDARMHKGYKRWSKNRHQFVLLFGGGWVFRALIRIGWSGWGGVWWWWSLELGGGLYCIALCRSKEYRRMGKGNFRI